MATTPALRLCQLLCCVFATLVFSSVSAERVDGYSARVPVADETAEARSEALQRALAEVLIKMSGRADAPSRVRGSASDAVAFFRYDESRSIDPVTGEGRRQLQLEVSFDPSMIDAMLREGGFPVLPLERPLTVAWLVAEVDGRRELISGGEVLWSQAVERASRELGVPVLLPLGDLTDRQAAREGDIWGGFHENLRAATARYDTRRALIGRIEGAPGRWRARWLFDDGNQVRRWQSSDEDVDGLLRKGLYGVAAIAAAELASTGGEIQPVSLRILGVSGLDDYVRVVDYLRALSSVEEVQPTAVSGEVLEVAVFTRGESALLQALEVDRVMTRAAGRSNELVFRLNP